MRNLLLALCLGLFLTSCAEKETELEKQISLDEKINSFYDEDENIIFTGTYLINYENGVTQITDIEQQGLDTVTFNQLCARDMVIDYSDFNLDHMTFDKWWYWSSNSYPTEMIEFNIDFDTAVMTFEFDFKNIGNCKGTAVKI